MITPFWTIFLACLSCLFTGAAIGAALMALAVSARLEAVPAPEGKQRRRAWREDAARERME